jgi:hypothetical protein
MMHYELVREQHGEREQLCRGYRGQVGLEMRRETERMERVGYALGYWSTTKVVLVRGRDVVTLRMAPVGA